MRYAERPPPPFLAPLVERIWTLEGDASDLGTPLQPVLPDGRPEIVLHFGEPFERVAPDGSVERQDHVLFAGQLTGRLVLRPTGRVAVLGIRLAPYAAPALLNVPQCELAGAPLPVEMLDPRLARSLLELRDRAGTPAFAARLAGEALARLFDAGRVDGRVAGAVRTIVGSHGRVAVGEVARRTGMTPRHLERRFAAQVGMGPKRLGRVVRFQSALDVLERARGPARGTRTALSCGYADQAHFVREFQELAGCAPGAWLVERAELTGFFAGGGEGSAGGVLP